MVALHIIFITEQLNYAYKSRRALRTVFVASGPKILKLGPARTHMILDNKFRRYAYNVINVCKIGVPAGDEILAVNNKPLHGLSHQEAIAVFKEIKLGEMTLHIGRRVPKRTRESCKSMRSP